MLSLSPAILWNIECTIQALFKQDSEMVHEEIDRMLSIWELWRCNGSLSSDHFIANYMWRKEFTERVGWSIPSRHAIAAIVDIVGTAKVLSIGTGLGLWETLLSSAGVNIAATDKRVPRKPFFRGPYECMDACAAVLAHPAASVLLIIWPLDFAASALSLFGGEFVIIIGENNEGGCTGDAGSILEDSKEWEKIAILEIPCWDGIHDVLEIYKRVYLPGNVMEPVNEALSVCLLDLNSSEISEDVDNA